MANSVNQATALQMVILGSVTKQHSNGRIVVQMRMPLNAEALGTMPDWAARGYEDVSKKYTDVDPEVQEMSDLAIAFTSENKPGELFSKRAMKVSSASLKGFKITRVGKPDAPEVELQFKLYLSFARAFWAWVGEMAGEEVYMTFPTGVSARQPTLDEPQLPLQAAEDDGAPDDPAEADAAPAAQPAAAGDTAEQPGRQRRPTPTTSRKSHAPPGKKSGPKDLQRWHEKQVAAGRADA